ARLLVELGRLLAQSVDRAVHVGVAGRVVLGHRLEHRPWLLAGGRRVQVHERVAVDHPAQDREIAACPFVESHRVNACWSTVRGSVTQRSRVGRTSVWRIVKTSSLVSFAASAADLPSTDSATTSAEAVQIAQESPVKRAAATCPSATRSITRTRSP